MTRRQRTAIAAAVVAVLAAVIVLIVLIRADSSAATPTPTPPVAAGPPPTQPAPAPVRARTAPAVADAPSSDEPDAVVAAGERGAREHRSHPPEGDPAAPRPMVPAIKQDHKMKPATIMAIRRPMRSLVARCAKLVVPPEARGPEPRLQGSVEVTVADGRIKVDGAEFQYRDIDESVRAPLVDCVRDGLASYDFPLPPAGDEPISGFILTLPFDLR